MQSFIHRSDTGYPLATTAARKPAMVISSVILQRTLNPVRAFCDSCFSAFHSQWSGSNGEANTKASKEARGYETEPTIRETPRLFHTKRAFKPAWFEFRAP